MPKPSEESQRHIKALYRLLHMLLHFDEQLALGENNVDATTTELLARIDGATNNIAAKIQALIDKAAAAGSATSAEINSALSPLVTSLEAIGKDPENPVPGV